MGTLAQRSRRHASRAVRRAQILDAAQRCFAERGYHRATMDDLALAAGLSKGSLYWHFRSKEQLLLALFDRIMERIVAATRPERAESAPVLDVILEPGRQLVKELTADREVLGSWLEFFGQTPVRARLAAAYRDTRRLFEELLRVGEARGEVGGASVSGMAVAITAAFEGLLLQAAVDPDFDAEAHWAALEVGLRRGFAA